MKIAILSCAIMVFFWACIEQKNEKPKNLFSQEEMVGIVLDIHLMEAKVQRQALPAIESNILQAELLQYVYQRHKTDSLTFSQSYDYYMEHIEELEAIYKAVQDSLAVMSNKKVPFIY